MLDLGDPLGFSNGLDPLCDHFVRVPGFGRRGSYLVTPIDGSRGRGYDPGFVNVAICDVGRVSDPDPLIDRVFLAHAGRAEAEIVPRDYPYPRTKLLFVPTRGNVLFRHRISRNGILTIDLDPPSASVL